MREEMCLIRDVLDKQLVDCDGTKMGKIDGIVLSIDADGRPKIDRLELGFAVLARRVHPRIEAWFLALRKRWSVRKNARQLVPWSKVIDISDDHVQVDLKALETPAFDWERWLRKHIVSKIPGSGEK